MPGPSKATELATARADAIPPGRRVHQFQFMGTAAAMPDCPFAVITEPWRRGQRLRAGGEVAGRSHQFYGNGKFGREKPQYGDALAQIAKAVKSAQPTVCLRLDLGTTGGSARKRVPSRSRVSVRSVPTSRLAAQPYRRGAPSLSSRRAFR